MEATSEEVKVDYAAWIGLDWGSEKHAIALQAVGSSLVERCELKQTPEALRDWFLKLRRRFPEARWASQSSKARVCNQFLAGFRFGACVSHQPQVFEELPGGSAS